ncbi:MAG: ABC transporter substrate-binding protein [Vulcanimicrobiota bacterium]
MKSYTKILVLVLVLSFLFLPSSCTKKTVEKGTFYTAGVWDIPPAYHGNPWAQGGVGVAGAYVHEPLFIYNPATQEYYSRLGESFEESEDHTRLTVKLKDNIKWHDGVEFTSDDVKTTFYIGYLKNMEIWKNLDRIELPDDKTVVFVWKKVSIVNPIRALSEPITSPTHIFGEWVKGIPDLMAEEIKLDEVNLTDNSEDTPETKQEIELTKKIRKVREVLYQFKPELPIGTGPFVVKKVSASDMLLEKFEDYYDLKNVKVDKVRITRWASNEVVWSYLIAGEVDAVTPACPYDVTQQILKKNPTMKTITPPDMSEFGLIFNCKKGLTARKEFRQAVAHLLNNDMIRKVAYFYGDTITDGHSLGIPHSMMHKFLDEEFLSQLNSYKQDDEKARTLLEKAGFTFDEGSNQWLTPEGEKMALEITAEAGLTDLVLLAEAASSQLSNFGIPTQVRTMRPELFSSSLNDHEFDMAASFGPQMGKFGLPAISYRQFYAKGGRIKSAAGLPDVFDYRGEKVNVSELTDELDFEIDMEKQKEIVRKLAWVTNQELPFISCYEKRLLIFVNNGKRVTGWPEGEDMIWRAAPGGVESLYCTMIVKGYVKPAE